MKLELLDDAIEKISMAISLRATNLLMEMLESDEFENEVKGIVSEVLDGCEITPDFKIVEGVIEGEALKQDNGDVFSLSDLGPESCRVRIAIPHS